MNLYPTAKKLLKRKTDNAQEPLLQLRRSLRSLLSILLWSGFAAYSASIYNPYVPGITFLGVHVGALWITPIILALETVRRYYNDLWIFDRYRVIHKKGRLSLTYNQPVVRYSHIRAITVSQSLLGRILNYGSIELGTAAQEDSEMIIAGVVCPRQFGELIDKMRLDIEKNAKKETRSPISMQQYIESKSDETRAASAN